MNVEMTLETNAQFWGTLRAERESVGLAPFNADASIES